MKVFDNFPRIYGKKVFLSGPMSGIENNNINNFIEAHLVAKELGAVEIYNPAINWLLETKVESSTRTLADYLAECCEELSRREENRKLSYWNILLQLDGWELSNGAQLEKTLADNLGIPSIALSDLVNALSENDI